jgi:hypothetical protein
MLILWLILAAVTKHLGRSFALRKDTGSGFPLP